MSEVLSHLRGQAPRFLPDEWIKLDTLDALHAAQAGSSKVIVPLSIWTLWHEAGNRPSWPASRLGILLKPSDDVMAMGVHQVNGAWPWHLIAVDFPVFRDGRGFSQAHLLRQRLGWVGELRAVGDVLIDQLRQLARVGFDAFALREDQNRELALSQFDAFSVQLQNDWRATRTPLAHPDHQGAQA